MSRLPDIALRRWKAKEQLSAADLNHNFDALLGGVETAMTAALTPDPAARALEPRIHNAEDRLAVIEKMLTMHERQRNEKEWAPLAYVAGVMQLVQSLIGPMTERSDALLAAHVEMQGQHHALATRIARLEQQPEAALAEDHRSLAAAHAHVAELAKMTLGQVNGLRQEVGHLRRMAEGHARLRNEMEWMPLSTGGELLRRVMDIEKRLDGDAC